MYAYWINSILMKKYGLLLCTFLLLAFAAQAQDVITLVNGTVIHGKVVHITPSLIIYTESNNPGRNIDIRKSAIANVVYANGSKTIYNLTGDTRMDGDLRGNGTVSGWYYGLTGSYGVGTVTNNDKTYTTGAYTTGGGKILATGMIFQHLGIQFGLGADYASYKVNYINKSTLYSTNDIFVQRYVTLPVRLLYLSNSRRRIGFYAVAGMDFSIFVDATDNEHDLLASYYNNAIVCPYGSLGIVLRNRNASSIWMLGPYYKTTMNNIYSQKHILENHIYMSTGNTGNVTTMGVTLSFITNFSKWKKDGYEK